MEEAYRFVTKTFFLANTVLPKPSSSPLLEGMILYLLRTRKVASPSRIFSEGGYGPTELCCVLLGVKEGGVFKCQICFVRPKGLLQITVES